MAFSLGRHFLFYTFARSPSNNPKLILQDCWIRNAVGVCTWAWDQRVLSRCMCCVVNHMKRLRWVPVKLWIYILANEWSYQCFLNAWISIRSSDRESWLVIHPEKGWLGCLSQWSFSQYTASVASKIPTWVNGHICYLWGQTSAAVWWQTSAQACASC